MDDGAVVRLERTFESDVERVFRAFTDPVELVWWWGPMNVKPARVGCGTGVLDLPPTPGRNDYGDQ
jgi:uncharacterized protein YndB with AHSA1/START domain